MKNFVEPFYMVDFNSSLCNFEIFVDNIPLFRHFEGGVISSHFPLNHFLLDSKSLSTLRVKIYSINESSFQEGSFFNFKIFCYDSFNNNYDSQIIILEKNNSQLIKSEIPFLEILENFNYELPFSNKGWKDSQKLGENSISDLNIFCKEIHQNFREKKISEIIRKMEVKNKEIDISLYLKNEDNFKSLTELLSKLENEDYILQELNTKLNFKMFNDCVAECNNGNESIICYKKQGTGEEFQLPILVCKPASTNKFMIIR